MISHQRTAVVLFNLGGPDNPESVKPFLFNLFNDKAIISLPQPFRFILAKFISSRREKKAQKIYQKIGGKSPLLDITAAQADALEKELSFLGDYKIFIAMRYWKPFAADVVKEICKYQPQQLIMLPLYPQFSSTTTESSVKDFAEHLMQAVEAQEIKKPQLKIICCYPEDEDFLNSHLNLIKQQLCKVSPQNLSRARILFSAHGLPQKVIDQGDPYVLQVELTAKKIIEKLSADFEIEKLSEGNILQQDQPKIDFAVCYQSKVGPLKWTSPSLEQEMRRVAIDKKIPVIVPIAFVSDHSETLVELDIDFKEMSQELGIEEYHRVASLNLEANFIKSLTKICANVGKNNAQNPFGVQKNERVFCADKEVRLCPKKMTLCFNPNPCKE